MNELPVQNSKGMHRFALQRLALKPLIGTVTPSEKVQIAREITRLGVADFTNYLHANALQQLWRQYLQDQNCEGELSETLEQLKNDAFNAAANTINEEHQLRMVFECFEQHSLPAFIFKGGQLRRTLYADPTLRPVSDIDLFVDESRKLEAARLLSELGFELSASEATVSHEASFIKNRICIDLHWQLFRPGRTRTNLSTYLFSNRQPFANGLWGLNPPASLLVMLVHPAFTKHLASPDSMLIHMVDLFRLLDQARENWQEVREVLEQSGTKTAAWSSLVWLHRLCGQDSIAELARQIQPKYLHKRYLEYWIDHGLVYRWFAYRGIIRIGFSLALQDSAKDVARAVYYLLRSRILAKQQVQQLNYQSTG